MLGVKKMTNWIKANWIALAAGAMLSIVLAVVNQVCHACMQAMPHKLLRTLLIVAISLSRSTFCHQPPLLEAMVLSAKLGVVRFPHLDMLYLLHSG